VPLNIYTKRSSSPIAARRGQLASDVLDELTAWDPREWITAVKRWHRGPLGTITLVHLNVIAELDMRGPLSMSHLAEALGVSVASATGIVDRMEGRGLVERGHTNDDRRVVMVSPTAKGSGLFRAIEARRRSRLSKLLDHLTDEEMVGFVVGLRALRQARANVAAGEDQDDAAETPADGPARREATVGSSAPQTVDA
jgi:DNA-binding MarR family transcriptional regulator